MDKLNLPIIKRSPQFPEREISTEEYLLFIKRTIKDIIKEKGMQEIQKMKKEQYVHVRFVL